jgi:23S rRNA pseudouridine2605 synthase
METKSQTSPEPIRLNRYLAQCGLGARRKCDELIASGHILVNGKKVTELGTKIAPLDRVEYKGKTVKPLKKPEYFAYHKPRGIMVTKTDPEGRPTIFDELKKKGIDARLLNYIGRLDYLSEGLLLLTSDGALIHALTHPRYHIKKVYNVNIDKKLTDSDRDRFLGGIESEGQLLRAGGVKRIAAPGNWYEIELYEGKNRQIRRMFEALSYQVLHLQRTKFAAVKLGDLGVGKIRPLNDREIAALMAVGFPARKPS